MITIGIPAEAIDLIVESEAFEATPYICPAGKLTIGYGHVITKGESFTRITETKARELLMKDAAWAAVAIARLIYQPLSHNQRAALISFVYNIGSGNFQCSTMRVYLNRGDYYAAAGEFWKWRRARGIIMGGLVKRRALEEALFREE